MTKEELEKEATEWVRQKFPMLDLKQSDMSKIHEYEAYLAGAEPREKQIEELKAQNKWYSEQVCNKECAEVWGNLDKAKEIIKTFLGFAEAFGYSPSMDKFITEAEQFISSEVEK